jgi:hypothetical protein
LGEVAEHFRAFQACPIITEKASAIRGLSSLPILKVGNAVRSRGQVILVNNEARALP